MKAKRGFCFFTGDVNVLDYGMTLIRKVAPRRFHFVELTNMNEACGSDNDGHPTYVVELSEVDLDAIGADTQRSAWRSCDGDCMVRPSDVTSYDNSERDLIAAGCCYEYGAKAPLHSVSTNNAHKGIRECRAESYSLTRDSDAYAARMERPVNKLGSTAREYMTGDITSAIVRGAESGDPAARIIGRMYVATDGQTLGGRLPAGDIEAIKGAINHETD